MVTACSMLDCGSTVWTGPSLHTSRPPDQLVCWCHPLWSPPKVRCSHHNCQTGKLYSAVSIWLGLKTSLSSSFIAWCEEHLISIDGVDYMWHIQLTHCVWLCPFLMIRGYSSRRSANLQIYSVQIHFTNQASQCQLTQLHPLFQI